MRYDENHNSWFYSSGIVFCVMCIYKNVYYYFIVFEIVSFGANSIVYIFSFLFIFFDHSFAIEEVSLKAIGFHLIWNGNILRVTNLFQQYFLFYCQKLLKKIRKNEINKKKTIEFRLVRDLSDNNLIWWIMRCDDQSNKAIETENVFLDR